MNPIKHVAIIMDGNGRWGLKHKNSRNAGHRKGLDSVESIIRECINCKINYLTLFTFSTENWKRPEKEIDFLFSLLENFLLNKIDNLMKNQIKLNFIGNRNKFSIKLRKIISSAETKTKNYKKLQINIALNYGSKDEIVNAVNNAKKKGIKINKKNIEKFLYTSEIPDPDLLIRTGNTQRLSNFLLWQVAYTEIFFEKKLWPDFSGADFKKIIKKFKLLKRNFGGIS